MEYVTQEILPPTVAHAAALAVVDTTDYDLFNSTVPLSPKTLVLAVFRGTMCYVYEVNSSSNASTSGASATTSSSSNAATAAAVNGSSNNDKTTDAVVGVKRLLFEDWVGAKVTQVASTCDGSLTALTDDLSIVVFTFDLIRKRVLKRFQSPLNVDDSAKVQRKSFTPSLIVAPSSSGQIAMCHAHEGYIHMIQVKFILSSQLTMPCEGALKRHQLGRYAPYALSFIAEDSDQYVAMYAATSSSSSSANRVGSQNFYTSIAKDRVTIITQTVVGGDNAATSRYSSTTNKNHRVKGVPFLVSCLTRTNATCVVTDESVALICPQGGLSAPIVQYSHGIEHLFENRIAVTSIFDMAPLQNWSPSAPPKATIPSVLLGLSDGRYYRILLDNNADDCESYSKLVNPFASWDDPDVKFDSGSNNNGCGASSSASSSAANGPLVQWNYGSMVRGIVAGVSPANGDVFLMRASEGSVLPSSVATCQRRMLHEAAAAAGTDCDASSSPSPSSVSNGSSHLLRGAVTGVIPINRELVTATSDGWIRRSHTVLDTDVIAQIPTTFAAAAAAGASPSAAPSKVSYHPIPSSSSSMVVMSNASHTQFMLRRRRVAATTAAVGGGVNEDDTDNGGEDDDELEMLPSSSSFFITDEPTLAFGFVSTTEAVQVTPTGAYWYTVDTTTAKITLASAVKSATVITKAYVSDDGAVAFVEKQQQKHSSSAEGDASTALNKKSFLKVFSRVDSEMTVVDLTSYKKEIGSGHGSEEVSGLCILPPAAAGASSSVDEVRAVLSFWGNTSELVVVSSAAKTVVSTVPITFNGDEEEEEKSSNNNGGGKKKVIINKKKSRFEIAAVEALNADWVIIQLSNGALFGRKISSSSALAASAAGVGSSSPSSSSSSSLAIPIIPKTCHQTPFIPGTLTINRELASIVVAGPTALSLMTLRTSGGVAAAATSSSSQQTAATNITIVTERRYAIPTAFNANRIAGGQSLLKNGNGNGNLLSAALSRTLTSVALFGNAAELMIRPRLLLANGTTMTAIVDLRASYTHQIIDEVKIGSSVINLMLCDAPQLPGAAAMKRLQQQKKAAAAEKDDNDANENESDNAVDATTTSSSSALVTNVGKASEPLGMMALVERDSGNPNVPPTFALTLLHVRPNNRISMADEKILPPTFIPSSAVNTALTFFKDAAPLGALSPSAMAAAAEALAKQKEEDEEKQKKQKQNAEDEADEKRKTETTKKSASPSSAAAAAAITSSLTEAYIIVGGCDLANGTGKLITVTTSGAAFTSITQTSVNAPVNDLTLTVADHEMVLVAATHFDLHVFKFNGGATSSSAASSSSSSGGNNNKSVLVPLSSLRVASPVLSLASSLSVVAAVSSGLIQYYEYSVGCLRERAAELLPLSTITAIAGVDGQFLKCDAQRNFFVNALAEKSKKVAKTDAATDKYSIPVKACTRLSSWTSKIIAADNTLAPIVDDVRQHMSLNTAYESMFVVTGISKRFYLCGADGSLSVMVRVPSELFRFLLKLESCLETYLDHDRHEYLVNWYQREQKLKKMEMEGQQQQENNTNTNSGNAEDISMSYYASQQPQTLWTIKDAKQCVSECRTLRSMNILNLKTMNFAFFEKLSEEEKYILVREQLQPDNADYITPVTVSAILQRCVALL